MSKEQLERKRAELVEQKRKLEAALLRLQGAITVLDELLAAMNEVHDGRNRDDNRTDI